LFQQRHKQQQKTLPTNPGTKKEGMPLTRHDKNKKKQKFFPSEEQKKTSKHGMAQLVVIVYCVYSI